jgi:hypothetical protein
MNVARAVSLLVITVALTGCSSQAPRVVTYSGDYPYYEDVAALCDDSQLVAVVTPLSSEVREVDLSAPAGDSKAEDPSLGVEDGGEKAAPLVVVETVTTVRIDAVFKGDAKVGTELEVGQPGGQFEGVVYEAERFDLTAGETALLFLNVWENAVPASPLNPTQGAYGVDKDGYLIPDRLNSAVQAASIAADKTLCSGS